MIRRPSPHHIGAALGLTTDAVRHIERVALRKVRQMCLRDSIDCEPGIDWPQYFTANRDNGHRWIRRKSGAP